MGFRMVRIFLTSGNLNLAIQIQLSISVLLKIISVIINFFLNTIFVSSHMYPENPESNRRLYEHGLYIRH